MTAKSSTALREQWIDAFVKHARRLVPEASTGLITATAERLYPHFGRFGPVEIAEAEWQELSPAGRRFSMPG